MLLLVDFGLLSLLLNAAQMNVNVHALYDSGN